MPYDITPLDTSTRGKLFQNFNDLSNQVLSDADIQAIMGRYGASEDQALNSAWNSAQFDLNQQFSPAMEALRRRSMTTGGLSGAPWARPQQDVMNNAFTTLYGRRMQLGGESAARKAAMLRQLALQKVSGRQAMGQQLYGRMLDTKKTPNKGQKWASAGLQLAGAGIGALVGGPAGAAAGAGLGGVAGGGITGQNPMGAEFGGGPAGMDQFMPNAQMPSPKYKGWGF